MGIVSNVVKSRNNGPKQDMLYFYV